LLAPPARRGLVKIKNVAAKPQRLSPAHHGERRPGRSRSKPVDVLNGTRLNRVPIGAGMGRPQEEAAMRCVDWALIGLLMLSYGWPGIAAEIH